MNTRMRHRHRPLRQLVLATYWVYNRLSVSRGQNVQHSGLALIVPDRTHGKDNINATEGIPEPPLHPHPSYESLLAVPCPLLDFLNPRLLLVPLQHRIDVVLRDRHQHVLDRQDADRLGAQLRAVRRPRRRLSEAFLHGREVLPRDSNLLGDPGAALPCAKRGEQGK